MVELVYRYPGGGWDRIEFSVNPRVAFIARMLMTQDGMLCSIGDPQGSLQEQQKRMTPEDLRRAKRRYRKAWRTADKKKVLRWKQGPPHSTYTDFGRKEVPENIKIERMRKVNAFYKEKARALLKLDVAGQS